MPRRVVFLFLGTVLLMAASFSYCSTAPQGHTCRWRWAKLRTIAGGSGSLCPSHWLLHPAHYAAPTWRVLHHGFRLRCPRDARGLRLSITEDDPETRLVIGHENSLFDKKIYFGV